MKNSVTSFHAPQALAAAVAFSGEYGDKMYRRMLDPHASFQAASEHYTLAGDALLLGYVARNTATGEIVGQNIFEDDDGAFEAALECAADEEQKTGDEHDVGLVLLSRETFEKFVPTA